MKKIINEFIMWQYLIGQPFIAYHEVKAMFPNGYPPEALTIFDDISQKTTRAGTLARLRDIQLSAARDAQFALACDMEQQLGRKIFG